MSSTFANTQYVYNFYINANGAEAEGSFTLPAGLGVDDAFALQLVETLNGMAWPTGVKNPFTVSKSSYESTSYTTDTSTNPPSFT